MNITQLPFLLADIIPPPPPHFVPEHLEGRGLASLGFLAFAVVAAGVLWWLRQRRISSVATSALMDRS